MLNAMFWRMDTNLSYKFILLILRRLFDFACVMVCIIWKVVIQGSLMLRIIISTKLQRHHLITYPNLDIVLLHTNGQKNS